MTPFSEAARLFSLAQYQIMDTQPEPAFDELVKVAASFLDVPIALISLIDHERQWFKARHGLDLRETSRASSFCQHVVLQDRLISVSDAREDERFAESEAVRGPLHVRAYAAAPLRTSKGYVLGTLCVIDNERPRDFSPRDLEMLQTLANAVMAHMETRLAMQVAERQRQHIEQIVRSKVRFIARTSHELRTPVAAILGYTELMNETLEAPHGEEEEVFKEDLESIRIASRHLVTLLDDLMDLAKLEDNKLVLRRGEFPLHALFDSVTSAVRSLVRQQGNVLVIEGALEPMIFADFMRLKQILINLVINANKFTEAGTIVLRSTVSCDPPTVCLSVRDTGRGIAPENLGLIFESFSQVPPEAFSSRAGVGLGLAICRELVELMGGQISVQSAVGQGSLFEVYLPDCHVDALSARMGDEETVEL